MQMEEFLQEVETITKSERVDWFLDKKGRIRTKDDDDVTWHSPATLVVKKITGQQFPASHSDLVIECYLKMPMEDAALLANAAENVTNDENLSLRQKLLEACNLV